MFASLLLQRRLQTSDQPGGVHFESVRVEGGWQSSLRCHCVDRSGAPYAWSGKEFKSEVTSKKKEAEEGAASSFFKDPDVQRTAANLPPAKRHVDALESWQIKRNLRPKHN